MNLTWTTGEFAGAVKSAQENFTAITSDTHSRWFEPGGLRDSLVAQEIVIAILFLLVFWVLLVLSVGVLIGIGVWRQVRSARWQITLQDTPLIRIMVTDFRSLSARDSLRDAVGDVLKSLQQDFPVLDGQNAAGVLSRAEMLESLERHGPETTLAKIVRPNLAEITPAETLAVALRRLQQTRQGFLAVIEAGRLLGFVTEESLRDYVRAETALHLRPQKSSLCTTFPRVERSEGAHHA